MILLWLVSFVGRIPEIIDQCFQGELVGLCHVFQSAEWLHEAAYTLRLVLHKHRECLWPSLQQFVNRQLEFDPCFVHAPKIPGCRYSVFAPAQITKKHAFGVFLRFHTFCRSTDPALPRFAQVHAGYGLPLARDRLPPTRAAPSPPARG